MTAYITIDDVDRLADRLGFVYRSRGLMESALAAPQPVFGIEPYPELLQKAAVLLVAINRNHPLLDGNKRLSWLVTVAFLAINGVELDTQQEEINRFVRAVAARPTPLAECVDWMTAQILHAEKRK